MPGYLLTMNCVVLCAHGGQAKPIAPNPRIKIMGTPVPQSSAPFMVAGCPVTVGPSPAPCIQATFLPATMTARVKSGGQPLLCESSMTGPVPSGAPAPLQPVSAAGQTRVRAQ